jgi:hypothetical protein
MRLNSITCSYLADDGRVDCLTDCSLKFVVQLWKNDDDDGAIMMEVQRRRGCAIAMKWLRTCLCKSVTSETQIFEASHLVPRQRPSLVLEKRIWDEMRGMDEIHNKPCCLDPRLLCLELLDSEKRDENRLGMESLLVLTDTTRVCRENAEEAVLALVYHEGKLATRLRYSFRSFFNMDRRCNGADSSFGDWGDPLMKHRY